MKMTTAYLWIASVLGCFLLVLAAPVEDSPLLRQLRESAMRISENEGLEMARRRFSGATGTGQAHHVTHSPVTDTSTHYGAHRVDRHVLFQHDATWCVARPVKQAIEHPGCASRTIDNKVCAGQCYSYSVPKIFPHTEDTKFHSCDCCQPSKVSWSSIPLSCNQDGKYEIVTKIVEMIEGCVCRPCSSGNPNSILQQYNLDVTMTNNNNTNSYPDESSYVEDSSYP